MKQFIVGFIAMMLLPIWLPLALLCVPVILMYFLGDAVLEAYNIKWGGGR